MIYTHALAHPAQVVAHTPPKKNPESSSFSLSLTSSSSRHVLLPPLPKPPAVGPPVVAEATGNEEVGEGKHSSIINGRRIAH